MGKSVYTTQAGTRQFKMTMNDTLAFKGDRHEEGCSGSSDADHNAGLKRVLHGA